MPKKTDKTGYGESHQGSFKMQGNMSGLVGGNVWFSGGECGNPAWKAKPRLAVVAQHVLAFFVNFFLNNICWVSTFRKRCFCVWPST